MSVSAVSLLSWSAAVVLVSLEVMVEDSELRDLQGLNKEDIAELAFAAAPRDLAMVQIDVAGVRNY